jgi:hypothetical protein
MFSALRARLTGDVRARSDFKARGAVFFTESLDRLFLIRKSIIGDFREQLRTNQLTELVPKFA